MRGFREVAEQWPLSQREKDRMSVLESLGSRRTGAENNELQVLILRLWLALFGG